MEAADLVQTFCLLIQRWYSMCVQLKCTRIWLTWILCNLLVKNKPCHNYQANSFPFKILMEKKCKPKWMCFAHGYSHAHKNFPRFCLTQKENILGLHVVTTPTQPRHNLNLPQLSWVWHNYDFARPPHHHPPKLNFNQNQPQSNI